MNNNKYYITVSFIPSNTYTYSYVIITVCQTYPNYNQIKSTAPVEKKKSPSKHALEWIELEFLEH